MSTGTPRLIIRGLSTISALGVSEASPVWRGGRTRAPAQRVGFGEQRAVFPFSREIEDEIEGLTEEPRYQRLDRVTYAALLAARRTFQKIRPTGVHLGCISIGSSRGPTHMLESTIRSHLENAGRVPIFTSPSTTAGNISSWVAQEYKAQGGGAAPIATITTSMTCSSAFHALLVARGFILGGMCKAALFGGAEACLTPYTLAQLEALRIYTAATDEWPCRPLAESEELSNSVALGEGAGTAAILADDGVAHEGELELLGMGWAMEEIPSATGISSDGSAFQAAMEMAAAQLPPGLEVDGVIAHAPGSRRGDEAELQAVSRVFERGIVMSTKHLTGHTYAGSGMLSLSLAQAVLEGGAWSGFPYPVRCRVGLPRAPRAIAINTAGFGGNAITVIVGIPRRSVG
jgi:3-oxoacyl-[acyl-carrier-protein] synthase II